MADARAIANKYKSPRYCRLERLEQYVDGDQYEGRWPFLAQGEDAPPLQERAPCIVYGITDNAINDLIDFMMGEGRYPQVSAGSSEDDEALDDEWGLDEDQSELFERWVNGPLTKGARLKSAFHDALAMAMGGGAVALVGTIRNGMPGLQGLPAKWCTPSFHPVTNEVIALEVFYPYLVEYFDENESKWKERCLLYRRTIDGKSDVVYKPGEGRDDGKQPAWIPDEAQTVMHGLGFCPVRWYAFDRREPTAAHYDGKAIHAALLDEIDQLNMSLSQRHRAALYTGDPQLWETGVDADQNPAPMARFARVQVEVQAARDGKPVGVYTASPQSRGGRGAARMKGPGVVWRYPSELSKVGMLVLPGDALESITAHADDLRKKIAEDLSVILIDPTDVKAFGALSGKALAFMFARQVSRADRVRQDAGDNLILACLDMLVRLVLTMHRRRPGSVRLPGMKKIVPVLEKFEQDESTVVPGPNGEAQEGVQKSWFGPRLDLQWGRYFPPSAEEENFLVTYCAMALEKGLMPLSIVLEKLREVFTFGSIEEIQKRLEEEVAKRQQQAANDAENQAKVGAKYAQGQPDGPPWPPEKKKE